ncbi:MAG: signal recognition particle receptor subunit alpha [Aigarchaeota archaeon]|nr:signal recognition particle receptor subunit alpha [Aigarchaeota archaeon]MDW8043886.1 signal recognition particle receptor subunit alpha [Nitrososphaerota archaeon]
MNLGEALRAAVSRFVGKPLADREAVEELVRGIQRALLMADVRVELVKELSDRIRERSERERPPPGISRKDVVLKVVYEELVNLLGGKSSGWKRPQERPHVAMVVGIQGSGKTTTVAKIANYLRSNGVKVGVVGADTYRPAALEQLRQLLSPKGIPVYGEEDGRDAVGIAARGVERLKGMGCEFILIDTAGRHRDQESLMREMEEMARAVRPNSVALVIDGTIGQAAGPQAEAFHRTTPIGWIVVTKLDTSARGGGALSAVAATGAPIRFIGTGERVEDIEPFDPESFVARLLGMPDLKSVVERVRMAELSVSEEEAKRILRGTFTLEDMIRQLREVRKAGPLGKFLSSLPIPGLPKVPEEELAKLEEQVKKFEAIYNSMTPEERRDPTIIDSSRARRIARGAGVREGDVKRLVKQYLEARRLMKAAKRTRVPAGVAEALRRAGGGA